MDRLSTRNRLVISASTLFWARTYYSTGVDELCAHADAGKGSFYHFFPSKVELAAAAIEARWVALRTTIFEPIANTDPPGLDRVRRLVEALADQQDIAEQTHQVVLGSPFGIIGQETAHREDRLRSAVQTVFAEQRGFVKWWIDEAVAAGEAPPGDTQARASRVLALLEGGLLVAKVANQVAIFRSVAAAAVRLATADE